jgi:hypothetical protein
VGTLGYCMLSFDMLNKDRENNIPVPEESGDVDEGLPVGYHAELSMDEVDVTNIQWMLSLTPAQRLRWATNTARFIQKARRARRIA